MRASSLFERSEPPRRRRYDRIVPRPSRTADFTLAPSRRARTMPRMISSRVPFFLAAFAFVVAFDARVIRAAEPTPDTNAVWFAEHYTKYEHRIAMRDGIKLFTRVFVPKDDSSPWPIVLSRTPYALKPYGSDNYSSPAGTLRELARDRFILVSQDVRGRYGSEGEYQHVRPFNPHKVMTVGGWFDAEDLFGRLETYRASERQNPGITNIPPPKGGTPIKSNHACAISKFSAPTCL